MAVYVLSHGLGSSIAQSGMAELGLMLEGLGHTVIYHEYKTDSYTNITRGYAELENKLAFAKRTAGSNQVYHVGHSLGGMMGYNIAKRSNHLGEGSGIQYYAINSPFINPNDLPGNFHLLQNILDPSVLTNMGSVEQYMGLHGHSMTEEQMYYVAMLEDTLPREDYLDNANFDRIMGWNFL